MISFKYTIEDMQQWAFNKGGKCLASAYDGMHTKAKWECDKGHQWMSTFGCIKYKGNWCPHCIAYPRRTLEEMQEIAYSRNGKCLSSKFINVRTKLLWECQKRHQWNADPSHIMRGSWCPHCAGKYKTIDDMRKIAEERGGKCLASIYSGMKIKVEWECAKGHIWKASFAGIKNSNNWCPICSHKFPRTIEEMQDIAKSRGGECLSEKIINVNTHLKWKCKEGHVWESAPSYVINKQKGSWCPYCAGKHKTIDDMKKIAEQLGGKCLSTEYIKSDALLEWQCAKGHIWQAKHHNIAHKARPSWCPHCKEYRGEEECRKIFEEIFNLPFKKYRLPHSRLELDGYCAALNLAFEYNGEQHYRRIHYWHQTSDAFIKQQDRDIRKKNLCIQLGIHLIVIPYTESKNLQEFIYKQCQSLYNIHHGQT